MGGTAGSGQTPYIVKAEQVGEEAKWHGVRGAASSLTSINLSRSLAQEPERRFYIIFSAKHRIKDLKER